MKNANDRYSRQIIFDGVGKDGQDKLKRSKVVIIGCGALGSVIANILVRAGVGKIEIIDRDLIEYHNLHRQCLFDEEDVKMQIPKAIAAERYLKKVNSTIEIKGIVADVNYSNVEKFVKNADVIADGLDNLETRYLINDISLKLAIPWVYGGALGAVGMTMTIIPGKTPCLRCIAPDAHATAGGPTCETAGIIASAPFVIGSLEAAEIIKILTGNGQLNNSLFYFDIWNEKVEIIGIEKNPDCPACNGKFEFLEARAGTKATSLCGQNAVQIINFGNAEISFPELANRLQSLGEVRYNEFMLQFKVEQNEIVVFPDGRAIIKNTNDEVKARSIYAKYIGI